MKSLLDTFHGRGVSSGSPACGSCGRYKKCSTEKHAGRWSWPILVVLSHPNKDEDALGKVRPVDRDILAKGFKSQSEIKLSEVSILFAAACHGAQVSAQEVRYCNPLFKERYNEIQPEVVICLGRMALEAVIGDDWTGGVGLYERWVGRQIPLNGTWVCPTYSNLDVQTSDSEVVERDAIKHIQDALALRGVECPKREAYESQVEVLYDTEKILEAIKGFRAKKKPVAFDYETNCLKPDNPEAKAVSVAIADHERCVSFCLEGGVLPEFGNLLKDPEVPKIAANLKMEERWTRMLFGHGAENWQWDTMLAAHALDNSPGATGLKFQAFVNFGVGTYNEHIEPYLRTKDGVRYNRIDDLDRDQLLLYGGMDAILEYELAKKQMADPFWEIAPMRGEPMSAGMDLLINGIVTLAKIEENGIGIDVEHLEDTMEWIKKRIKILHRKVREHELWGEWRKRYSQKSNIRSRDQLKWLIYERLGYPVTKWTDKGHPSTDAEALSVVDHPFVKMISDLLRYDKALGTFLKGIHGETVGDRLHAIFNLHIARTFRSSSDSPNFQNFPVRDKKVSQIIRTNFVPRSEDHMLVECDFKGIEVSMSHCYHKDPVFYADITDPGRDMHRDMAAECYMVDRDQVSKDMRYGAKNKFVFPQFYGDYFRNCAKALWEWMRKAELKTVDGKDVETILSKNGIHDLGDCDHGEDPEPGTFEYHVKEVEKRFWNERYKVYGKWRKDWHARYLERGYFDLLTGFRIQGDFRKNAVVNYCVQGSAFHCLLWSLTKVQKLLENHEMETMLVGQIHDSMIADVPVRELRKFLSIVERVTSIGLTAKYKWLTVPMVIEYEASPPGASWFDKKEFEFKDGKFMTEKGPTKQVNNFLEEFCDE